MIPKAYIILTLCFCMVKIDVKGGEALNSKQVSELNGIVGHYTERIERKTKINKILIKIKTYSNTGKAHKYSINLSVVIDIRRFEADAIEWDFNAAVREAFNKILMQMKHEYRYEF